MYVVWRLRNKQQYHDKEHKPSSPYEVHVTSGYYHLQSKKRVHHNSVGPSSSCKYIGSPIALR